MEEYSTTAAVVSTTTIDAANGHAIEVGSQRRLSPRHLEELAASGIDDATAKAAGLYSEHDRGRLARLAGWQSWPAKYGSALVFPYPDADGEVIQSRLKPERPPDRNGRAAKYLSPSGSKTRVYFPPGVRQRIGNGAVEVLVTEGEKKSLSAARHGYSCIGLSGVEGWHEKGRLDLHPELKSIKWRGRTVFVAFDSDASEKAEVRAAESKLAAALAQEGATVRIIRIPPAADGAKKGLDDFIVAEGPAAVQKLMNAAEEPEPIDPGELKQPAAELDAADVANRFLRELEVDGHCRLRFWRGEWWLYRQGGYRPAPIEDVRARLIEHLNLRFFKLGRRHVSDVMQHLEAAAIIPSHTEPPAWLGDQQSRPDPLECVATASGIIDLPVYASGGGDYLTKPTPAFFTTTSLGWRFEERAPYPKRWHEFLHSLWPDDEQSIDVLQRWCGLCLTPDTRHQKILELVGPMRSGKGTIARVVTELVGRANVASPTLGSLTTNFGLWPLLGKTLAIISDARFSARADQATLVERLLSISGEDSVTVDRKNLPPLSCKLSTRFMLITNELPRLSDASGALVGRLVILRTPHSFFGREDHDLTEKLLEELPGIFCWAVAGWSALKAEGRFTMPDSSLELAGQMADLSSPVSAFVRDCCVVNETQQVEVDAIFKAWQAWCEDANRRAGDKGRFGRDLSAAFPHVHKARPREGGKRIHVYEGIGLHEQGDWS